MDKYKGVISFSLTKAQLLDLLGDETEIKFEKARVRSAGTGNGARHNGTRGHGRIFTIIKRALHDGPQPSPQLRLALENAGLSAQSLGPALTALKRGGQIVRHSQGVYGLARQSASMSGPS
jgi:hypothetical protein